MQHFYYTWCRAGRSLRGNAGWGVRHVTGGLSSVETDQLAKHANYSYRRGTDDLEHAPAKLAYLRASDGQALLVHCRKIGFQPGSKREGNYFAHVITDLDETIHDGLDAIRCWGSSGWVEGDFDEPPEPADDLQATGLFKDELAIQQFLKDEKQFEWAHYCLQAWKLAHPQDKKILIGGDSRHVAHLIYIIAACLPKEQRKDVTFTTYDSLESPPIVRIHGVFPDEGSKITDGFYRPGQYTLNTLIDRFAELTSNQHEKSCRELLARLRDYGAIGVDSILQFSTKIKSDSGRDMELAFRLFPEAGKSIELDEDERQHLFTHFGVQFIDYLTLENREGFFWFLRQNHPPVRDKDTQEWLLAHDHLEKLTQHARQSPEAREFLVEFFEHLNLQYCLKPGFVEHLGTYLAGCGEKPEGNARYLKTLALCAQGKASPNPIHLVEAFTHLAGQINEDYQACRQYPDRSVRFHLIYQLARGSQGVAGLQEIHGRFHFLFSDKADFLFMVSQSYIWWDAERLPETLAILIGYAVAEGVAVPECLVRRVHEDPTGFLAASQLAISQRGALPEPWGNPITLFRQNIDLVKTQVALGQLIDLLNLPEVDRAMADEYRNEIVNNNTAEASGLRIVLDERIIHHEAPQDKFAGVYDEYIATLQPDDFIEPSPAIDFLNRLFAPEYRQAWSALSVVSKDRVGTGANSFWNIHHLKRAHDAWGGEDYSYLKSCVALFYIHRHDRSTPEKFQEMLIRKILDSIQDPSDLVELILSIPVPADHPRRSDMFLDAREKYTLIKKLADEFNKSSNKPNKSSIIGAILLGAACLNEDGTIAQGDKTQPVVYQYLVVKKRNDEKEKEWMDHFANDISSFIQKHLKKITDEDEVKILSWLSKLKSDLNVNHIRAMSKMKKDKLDGPTMKGNPKSVLVWLSLYRSTPEKKPKKKGLFGFMKK